MVDPEFKITNKMLMNIVGIEVSAKIVEFSQLKTDWELRMKMDALSRRVVSFIRFGGGMVGLEEVSKIVRDEPGRDDRPDEVATRLSVVGKEKEIQMTLNLLNVFKLMDQIVYLSSKFNGGVFGESDCKKINTLLGERVYPGVTLGVFRNKELTDNFGLVAPNEVEVPFQVEDFFAWFNSSNKKELHKVFRSGIVMAELLRVSPFFQQNLETAVCFANLSLMESGYGYKGLLSFEEELLKSRESLLAAYSSIEKNNGDMTVWLEYFTKCLFEASDKLRGRIVNLLDGSVYLKSEGGRVVPLTERQILLMEQMTIAGEMTIKEVRSVLPMVSDDTILRDLNDLIEKKLIGKKGKTKGAVYVLKKTKRYR